jgi:hypothetical protein
MKWFEKTAASGPVYYRGSTLGDSREIEIGDPWWDAQLFVATSVEKAKNYGDNIEVITLSPGAKIAKETPTARGYAFPSLRAYPRQAEKTFEYYVRAAKKAQEKGYDVIEFFLQASVGTIILNLDAIVSREPLDETIEEPEA